MKREQSKTAARSVVLGPSQRRLEQLIDDRMQPGADRRAIDRRIWELFGGKWCVMFTDLSGFSRHVARYGIIHFLQNIYASECILKPVIERYGGMVIKFEGDSLLAVFRRPLRAARAALEMQAACLRYNQGRRPEDRVLLCLGLGYGPMLRIGDYDIFGAEVNAAAKLGEDMAKTGEILVTGSVKKALGRMPKIKFIKLSKAPPGAKEAFRMTFNE